MSDLILEAFKYLQINWVNSYWKMGNLKKVQRTKSTKVQQAPAVSMIRMLMLGDWSGPE